MAILCEMFTYNRRDPLTRLWYGLFEDIGVPFDLWMTLRADIILEIIHLVKLFC